MSVAVIGRGWVGSSMSELFPSAYVYTHNHGEKSEVNRCDVAFVCVPTPLKDGFLDTSIVEEIVSWCECPLIVIRSTVNPGTCDRLSREYDKRIVFQPEYLGETPDHPRPQILILGGNPDDRRVLIDLYTSVYNANIKIRQVTAYEAEVIKLSENRAIAFKVMQAHELYEVCEKANLDYYTIRDAVYGDDPRFNLWFTFIYDQLGFHSSKCLKKDVEAWCSWALSFGYDPKITNLLVQRSQEYAG